MSEMKLQLEQEVGVPGGALKLTGVRAYRGQETVACFHAWIGERYREVELRVGDVAQAGEVEFELRSIAFAESIATIATAELALSEGAAALGEAFDIRLGQRLTLAEGRTVLLTAIGHFGIQLLFKSSEGPENYAWFDFGFWRDDALLFELETFDRAARTARLLVSPEGDVNHVFDVAFGELVSLGPRDVALYPDSTTLRLRRAEYRSYDAVDWRLIAEHGDDVSYPYAGSITTGGEPDDDVSERDFRLLGRSYTLRPVGASLKPKPVLRFAVASESVDTFPLGVPFSLTMRDSREGPDGILLSYLGEAHGHGESVGPDGEFVPCTVAWAEFSVVMAGVTSGFNVDLMEFDEPVTKHVFGYSFTVSSVSDIAAVVRVEPEDVGGLP